MPTENRVRLLYPPEAAIYLTVAKQTLATWRSQGRGPKYLKLGHAVRYRLSDLDEWIDAQLTGGE